MYAKTDSKLLLVLLIFSTWLTTSYGSQVQLGNTTLVGSAIPSLNQEFFGGIPFAEPPLGELRFAPPVLKTSLGVETFNATEFGPACLQPPARGPLPVPISEDCLTINILRPAGLPYNSSLPVMAWIYGGGFFLGGSAVYNGSTIVAQSVARGTPIIYVNFNYRLGPLGFPQGSEADSRGALNLGLKDQIVALEWIQHNIGAFGGDRSKVTLFGESAGAMSVGVLLLSRNIESLIRGAILESGSASSPLTFNASRRENDWDNFVQAVPECASLVSTRNTFACLRNVSSTEILTAFEHSFGSANEQFPWVPTIDGPGGLMPELPSELYAKGEFAQIPFIAGTNLDEGTIFTPSTINSSETIHEWIVTNHSTTQSPADIAALEQAANRILELYPDIPALGSPFNTGNETFGPSSQFKRLAAITDDLLWQSVRRLWIQAASNHGVKTFGYLFTDPPPLVNITDGVFHGAEVIYLYPNTTLPGFAVGLSPNPSSANLSIWLIDYWVSFATSLDPNDGKGSDRPRWNQYTPRNQELLQLNAKNTTMIKDDYRAEQIDFINSQATLFRH